MRRVAVNDKKLLFVENSPLNFTLPVWLRNQSHVSVTNSQSKTNGTEMWTTDDENREHELEGTDKAISKLVTTSLRTSGRNVGQPFSTSVATTASHQFTTVQMSELASMEPWFAEY